MLGLKIIFLSFLILGLIMPAAAKDDKKETGDIKKAEVMQEMRQKTLKRIQQSLERHKTVKADFIQRSQDGHIARGVFYLERPGKMRFEYTKDIAYLVVSNGSVINFIDYELREVMRMPLSKTPFGLFANSKINLDDKRIKIPALEYFAGLVRMTIIDPAREDYGQITLIFDEARMDFRGWEILDQQGSITQVNLLNPTYDIDIKNKIFTFKDPRPKRSRKH